MYTLITWASSWIGKLCAQRFAKKWHNLILIARSLDKLEIIKSDILKQANIDIILHSVDVSDSNQVDQFFKEIAQLDINVCINNAGLALWEDEFTQANWTDLDTMMQVNIVWYTHIAHQVLPFLKKTKGYIFNISSVAWVEPYEWWHVYCASKAYVKMLSKSLRIELMGSEVRVTDIAPGWVDTEWFAMTRFKWNEQKAQSIYQWYEPLHTADIVDAIEFCFDRPSHVNIEYLAIMSTAQATARRIHKKN